MRSVSHETCLEVCDTNLKGDHDGAMELFVRGIEEGEELDLELSGSYYPGDPGKTYGPPEDCYPPEPAELDDFCAIANLDGHRVDITDWLTKEAANRLEDELMESVSDDYDGY